MLILQRATNRSHEKELRGDRPLERSDDGYAGIERIVPEPIQSQTPNSRFEAHPANNGHSQSGS